MIKGIQWIFLAKVIRLDCLLLSIPILYLFGLQFTTFVYQISSTQQLYQTPISCPLLNYAHMYLQIVCKS